MARPSDSQASIAVRTFICIDVPAAIKERIDRLQQHLRRIRAGASWTRPENVHVTLKFLGDVDPSRLPTLFAAVRSAAAAIEPFEIEISGTGCFPSVRNPRVLWVGLSAVPAGLLQIQQAIEAALHELGFPRETKAFSPHLTIARIREPRNGTRLAEELLASGFSPESYLAREVIVMKSALGPGGSRYTPQFVAPIGRSGDLVNRDAR